MGLSSILDAKTGFFFPLSSSSCGFICWLSNGSCDGAVGTGVGTGLLNDKLKVALSRQESPYVKYLNYISHTSSTGSATGVSGGGLCPRVSRLPAGVDKEKLKRRRACRET